MQPAPEHRQHFLLPGALFVPNTPYYISTVLGSCISVCLWDQREKKGGMNHYKLPLWNGDGLPSPKFGNIAIQKLVEKMQANGCAINNIQAKVFGGAAVIQSSSGLLNVGARNIMAAKEFLASYRIPIIAQDMGGELSRKIIFDTASGGVRMKKAQPQ